MNNEIEVRIYSSNFELLGVVDEFSSLIWIRRYQEPGEFELHTPYSMANRNLLVGENIVQKFDKKTTTEAGVIEYVEMTEDEIIIKGRFLESYLNRRLIKNTTFYRGNAEDTMRSIISNMVAFPLLFLGTDKGLTETLEFQVTYKIVLNTIQKVCRATGYGFRIRPDFTTRKMYFEVYDGKDLTIDTSPKVIFSETYDNLQDERYIYDSTSYKTKAYCTQTINDVRKVYAVGSGSGRELREYHVATSVDTNEQTEADIKTAMETQGYISLEKNVISESFSFTTNDTPFIYQDDYDLGDKVIISHNAWNINTILRITEIEEDYEDGGREIHLTCGNPQAEKVDFEEE